MSPYAVGTVVPVEKSIEEIRRLLVAHGATHYAYGSGPTGEVVQFAVDGRFYRFDVVAPDKASLRAEYVGEDGNWQRERNARQINWDLRVLAEHKRRWRARVLWLKALLEFMDEVPLEQALLANLVLPDGRTFGDWAAPQVEGMYDGGRMPPLLGSGR